MSCSIPVICIVTGHVAVGVSTVHIRTRCLQNLVVSDLHYGQTSDEGLQISILRTQSSTGSEADTFTALGSASSGRNVYLVYGLMLFMRPIPL